MSTAAMGLSLRGFLSASKNATSLSSVVRGLSGKALREDAGKKPKPWDYKNFEFNMFWYLFDRTTLRFDENTKLVVVEGAHAVGKSKFAQELAEELDMLYLPQVNMDTVYKSPYGHIDLRDYNEYFLPRNKTYDEKDFVRNPLGPAQGCADRLLLRQYQLKFRQYVLALRHIFNTGQGVVLEKSPYSHHVEVEAAYNAGWVSRSSMPFYSKVYEYTLHYLLRPNLIIYLDAPTDVVQKKIKARGNEWDKQSPVWSNTQYLNEIYNTMKRDYLKQAKGHSQVLVYDWSEPGETEIVVEDIERLNFDHYGLYEDQQKDWRLYNDEYCTVYRLRYSQMKEQLKMYNAMSRPIIPEAVDIYKTAEEDINMKEVGAWLPGHKYAFGYNEDMGDSVLFKLNHYPTFTNEWLYPFESIPHPEMNWTNAQDFVPK